MNIKETIQQLIGDALAGCVQSGVLSSVQFPPFNVETPRMKDHGDYATNVAMLLAPQEKKPPRDIAQQIIKQLHSEDARVDIV